jgi:recombination-promoting nuclease RpnB
MIMSIADALEERGRQKGIQQGIQKGVLKIAKRMLYSGLNRSLIQEITDLSDEELESLERLSRFNRKGNYELK